MIEKEELRERAEEALEHFRKNMWDRNVCVCVCVCVWVCASDSVVRAYGRIFVCGCVGVLANVCVWEWERESEREWERERRKAKIIGGQKQTLSSHTDVKQFFLVISASNNWNKSFFQQQVWLAAELLNLWINKLFSIENFKTALFLLVPQVLYKDGLNKLLYVVNVRFGYETNLLKLLG